MPSAYFDFARKNSWYDEKMKDLHVPDTHSAQFADSTVAFATARRLYPTAHLELIDHGYDNIVVLADDVVALRFPRNDAALNRDAFEEYILEKMRQVSPVDLPFVMSRGQAPAYFVTHFVAGEHVQPETARLYAAARRRRLGEQVARFAFALHTSVAVEEFAQAREQFHLDEQPDNSWEVSIQRHLAQGTFPSSAQDAIAKEYYQQWQALPREPRVVVHDDLLTNNLLFVGDRLNGVLDFGDTTIGTAEQELRHLYHIDDTALEASVRMYEQLAHRPLDIAACRVWAIVQELVAYGRQSAAGRADHPSFLRARQNLNRWFATDIW